MQKCSEIVAAPLPFVFIWKRHGYKKWISGLPSSWARKDTRFPCRLAVVHSAVRN